MASASEFSATPEENTTIGGINVAEGCSPAGLNNVERYLAAAMRTLYNQVQTVAAAMPKAGGTFTGDISREGRGGYLHHAGSAQTDGRLVTLPEGSSRPAAAEGVTVWYYQ